MKTLKTGDRVAVYGAGYRRENMGGPYSVPGCTAWRGVVKDFDSAAGKQTQFLVKPDGDYEALWVHPKQCRRLRPKRKRREFRIAVIREPDGIYFKVLGDNASFVRADEIIHVREVLK